MKSFKRLNDWNDIVFWFVVIGAINLGSTALGFNLINMIIGSYPTFEKLVYIIIGICGVILALNNKNRNFMR